MMNSLNGRSIVVTGGAGALGMAIVKILVDLGAKCHVPCRSQKDVEEASKIDPDAVTAVGDIDTTDEETVVAYYKQFGQETNFWASVHIVGGFAFSPALETSASLFRQQLEVNAVSAFLCSREAVRHLLELNKGGRIVNVAARPALEPRNSSGLIAYTASKAAVAAMSQSFGEEVASHRIWVNAIAPSIMDTPVNRQAMPDADFEQWVKVEEVARTVAFLVSPQNECVRSGVIPVYGCV